MSHFNPETLTRKLQVLAAYAADCRAHGDSTDFVWSSGSHRDELGRRTDAEWDERGSGNDYRLAILGWLEREGVPHVVREEGITLLGCGVKATREVLTL